MSQALYDALMAENIAALEQLIADGADVNSIDPSDGSRPLTFVIQMYEEPARRHVVLRCLLDAGADPRLPDDDDEEFLGPLFCAMLARDPVSLQMLLAAGADPALEHIIPGETLYEAAEFDYLLETWMMTLPEEPDAEDQASEEGWLAFLTHIAIKHGKPEPDCMTVLWHAGARRSPKKKAPD